MCRVPSSFSKARKRSSSCFVFRELHALATALEESELTPRQLKRRMGQKLVAAWDKENPNHQYEGNTWKFWRDFNRVRRAILYPAYDLRSEE